MTASAPNPALPGAPEVSAPVTSPAGRVPPWPVWAAAATAALLHALPFLRTRLEVPETGFAWMGVPYNPKDWLAYIALIRTPGRTGEVFLADPFTTEPQGGRFVLLLHHALALVHRATGADPGWLLEGARAAGILVFALVLWRFLDGVFASPRTRTFAVVLALLSGGLGFLALAAEPALPIPELRPVVASELRATYGWTTYEALHNPLWVVGLALFLVAVRPLVQPAGPRTAREAGLAGAALLANLFTHPYSAIACVAVVTGALALERLLGGPLAPGRLARTAGAVCAPLAVAAAVAFWQRQDAVFRWSSGGVFGMQGVGVGWYPIAFAGTGVLAILGAARWTAARHPWRHAVLGWLAAIALLHSSTVLNGYHYLLYAYLPVAILAAGPALETFDALRARGARLAAAALGFLLFANTPAGAAAAWARVEEFQVTADMHAYLRSLAASPPANVLTVPELGNLVPAFGPQRVWVGQWFLTPQYAERAERAKRALTGGDAEELRRIVREGMIDEVVVPTASSAEVAALLADHAPVVQRFGTVSRLLLRRP